MKKFQKFFFWLTVSSTVLFYGCGTTNNIPESSISSLTETDSATKTDISQEKGIEGFWLTKDDKTGKDISIVQIYKNNGKYFGKVVKTLRPEDEGAVCYKCEGEDKDKPIIGLIIIKNLTENDGKYEGGTILDPETGNVYNCSGYLEADGQVLKLRGSLKISSFLGRTQTWRRTQVDQKLLMPIEAK